MVDLPSAFGECRYQQYSPQADTVTPLLDMPPRPTGRSPRRSSSVVSLVGLLVAACCFWQGLPAVTALWRNDVQARVAVAPPTRELVRVPIKDLRPGRRVIAGNPELHEALADTEIDPAIWRLITLVMLKGDGSRLDIELLRSLEWIELETAVVGQSVDLDLEELGAAGPAEVIAIAACPPIEPDDSQGRRVITGTFKHSSGDLYDLQIAGEPAAIGVTGNHPFWSEDRHAFVPTNSLTTGERLSQVNGATTTVVSLNRRTTTEPVYNLEVDVDHVYHVGAGGVLVHNECTSGPLHHMVSIYDNGSRPRAEAAILRSRHILQNADIGLGSRGGNRSQVQIGL